MEAVEQKYDTIMNYYDFTVRSEEEQKRYLIEYRKRFSNKDITDAWGKKPSFMYTLMNKLGIDAGKKVSRTGSKKQPAKQKAPAKIEAVTEPVPTPEQAPSLELPEADGFAFRIKGTYNASAIIKRLEKLELMLSEEESEFEIDITIKEL